MAEQIWFMIAGSAQADKDMMAYAKSVTERAISQGYCIIVGDNPSGVDRTVVETLQSSNAPECSIVHLAKEPLRVLAALAGQPVISQGTFEEYVGRDENMVIAANRCFFIWNGKSKGTKAGYEYAIEQGREAWLANFAKRDPDTRKKPLVTYYIPPPPPVPQQVALF